MLGRPGNNVSIGIVGMPNVGKSTIFNILSNLNVPAENYPYARLPLLRFARFPLGLVLF